MADRLRETGEGLRGQDKQALVAKALEALRVKLLDLGKRNRLLNFRDNRYCVKVVDEQPNQVFEYLVQSNKSMVFSPLPEPDKPGEVQEDTDDPSGLNEGIETLAAKAGGLAGIDISEEAPVPEADDDSTPKKHKDNRLQTALFMEELEFRLRRIGSKAKSVIEETGRNQLFLAMGFLRWKERGDSEGSYEAPLIMIPVELERGGLDARTRCFSYKLTYTGEDLIPNLSLLEKLKADGIVLPGFEDEDVIGGEGEDIDLEPEAYFEALGKAVSSIKGWEVRRRIILGFFSFSKLLMYDDLDAENWPNKSILKHEHITTLLVGGGESGTSEFSEDGSKKTIPTSLPLVLDADSSQTEAILKALRPQSIVVQGPPGTGKSQTITNLIGCFLNEGKSVLFVAEKMAALDVVYRNLEKVRLADFCLEVHSHKAEKKKVLASLERRYHLRFADVDNWDSEIERLDKVKKVLGEHVELVKKPVGPNEETIFQIFGKVEILREKLEKPFTLSIENIDRITSRRIEEATGLLGELGRFIGALGLPCESAWYGFEATELVYGDDREVIARLESAKEGLAKVAGGFGALGAEIDLSASAHGLSLGQLRNICTFGEERIPGTLLQDLANAFLLSDDSQVWEVLASLKSLASAYGEKIKSASKVFKEPEQISWQELDRLGELLSNVQDDEVRSTSLEKANEIGASCLRLSTLIEQFQAGITKHLAAGLPRPENLLDIRKFSKIDYLVRNRPPSAKSAVIERLLESGVRVLFTELMEKGLYLNRERDCLNRIFVLQDICDEQRLAEVRRALRFFEGKFFAFLSPEYIRAKRTLFKFLRVRLMAKSPKIVEDLERLENFLAEKKVFSEEARYKEVFGELFKGMDTDWESLKGLVIWATNLSDLVETPGLAKQLGQLGEDVTGSWVTREELEETVTSIEHEMGVCVKALGYATTGRNDASFESIPLETLRLRLGEVGKMLTSVYESASLFVRSATSALSEIAEAVKLTKAAKKLSEKVDSAEEFRLLAGRHFRGVNTDVDGIAESGEWFRTIRQLNLPCEFATKMATADISALVGAVEEWAMEAKPELDQIKSCIESLGKFGKVDFDRFLGSSIDECVLGEVDHKIQQVLAHTDYLTQWADYSRLAHRGRTMGLGILIELIEKGELTSEQAADTYLYTIYQDLAKKVLREHPMLATFSRTEYESKRERFAELDKSLLRLSQQRIAYNASRKRVPQGTKGARVGDLTDEWLLRWEFKKERRHLPIRKLMERAGDAIRALKPVFMMSPMSVAQFLSPGKHKFDVVIMDEASQIQPHEALGAIARAKEMIIVGDSKQLPPTTFFEAEMSNPDDDQEDFIFNELDASTSILDICETCTFPKSRLEWHYRSEHESLIAFSNLQWYDGTLIIFPSSGTSPHQLGIQFHFIEKATYAGGRNVVEARCVAQKIIEHARKSPELSLGVGTFNLKQRELIEDCLARLLKEDPSAESSVAKLNKAHGGTEPLFIKNLENLQGDERDVIFISCTFGPDKETGKVFQRFGPINGVNGPRRLNVLFTRAKKRIEVFSSMRAEDIQADPGYEGRVALKGFLKYAETGRLPDFAISSKRPPDSDFEVAVGRVLRNLGHEIQPQVGVAGYFIDIGVKNPNRRDEYILGVECDGAMYHSSVFARDRDRLREEVLSRRGWRIHRIWSTDWFKNRKLEIERLSERLQRLIEEDKAVIRAVEEPREVEPLGQPPAERRVSDAELESQIRSFCLEHIPRSKEDQEKDGFLNPEVLSVLVTRRPTTKADFRAYVRVEVHANMDNDDVQYLEDILDIIERAG
jgi:very-short-patch-repair endonuclease